MAKVMLVDDDRTTVKLLRTLLELDGFNVITVERGREVMDKVISFQPHLILMDYHLDDIEGTDVIKQIRAAGLDIPIVMASGMDVSKEAMEAGANKFLIKPFEPDELPGLIRQLIG
ncbi:MAG: response regulator [Chloroflexi bacterium AL-W]|nr:response regulator [Chloroflexi bacterium AL-W]